MNIESINNQENPYFHDMETTLVGVNMETTLVGVNTKELQNHPHWNRDSRITVTQARGG